MFFELGIVQNAVLLGIVQNAVLLGTHKDQYAPRIVDQHVQRVRNDTVLDLIRAT
ncbi:hypothetical protein AURDEDRAFT_162739 [Auricularia subglabra TFB-10046 SS5]|nr:hypothetical protein AURDEDRAFT_162739 [Auricularia subglabra TFB-10046 SS5]